MSYTIWFRLSLNYLRRLRVVPPEPCNQGQAAQLISHAIACNSIERVRHSVETTIMKGEL